MCSIPLNDTWIFLIFGYVGILTHYIKKWSDNKGKPITRTTIWMKLPGFILSMITTTLIISLREEASKLFVCTKLGAFFVGFLGNSWFFSMFTKRIRPGLEGKVVDVDEDETEAKAS